MKRLILALLLVLPLPAVAQELDIEAVFNCTDADVLGTQNTETCLAARGHIFNNCTSCHSFVPIVKAQKTPEAWDAHMAAHRERVTTMTDTDYGILTEFLKSHYRPDREPPKLPPALEALSINSPA